MADPERAEALVQALPEADRAYSANMVTTGLLHRDVPRALQRLTRPEASMRPIVDAARQLVVRDPKAARTLLDCALPKLEAARPDWYTLRYLSRATAVARALGDPRAGALAVRAAAMAPQIVPAWLERVRENSTPGLSDDVLRGITIRSIAQILAPADTDAALALLDQSPDGRQKVAGRIWIAMAVAAQEPARALTLAETVHPEPMLRPRRSGEWEASQAWQTWSWLAAGVVAALAPADASAATALARRLPHPQDRARALAAVARALPPERALPACREALAAARQADGSNALEALAIVAEATPPGCERREACAALLQAAATWTEGSVRAVPVAAAAFALAPTDPEGARALLEELLAGVGGTPKPDEARRAVAVAFAPIDPRRGIEVAQGIPRDNAFYHWGAQWSIANYLLATPEERRQIWFEHWCFTYPFNLEERW